jgi:hypothetical protein
MRVPPALWTWTALLTLALPVRAQSWNPFSSGGNDAKNARDLEPTPYHFPRRVQARPVRVLKFRFWADRDFRGLTPAWKIKTRAWLSQMSRLLGPPLDVEFEGESFRTWDRQASNGSLSDALAALNKEDGGQDVDFVVGLIGALPVVSNDCQLLGQANGGRGHFVVRAMGNVGDARVVYALLPKTENEQKEDLYARRVQHKELGVFMHEWAHALGVGHGGCGGNIMCPVYTPAYNTFTEAVLNQLDQAITRKKAGGLAPNPVAVRQSARAASAPVTVAPAAAQNAAASSLIGAMIDRARAQQRAGDRDGATATLIDAVARARVVAPPGDGSWLSLAQACVDARELDAGEEALGNAAAGAATDAVRAQLAALRPRPARKRR